MTNHLNEDAFNVLATIEQYLQHTLSKEQRAEFEQKMKTDVDVFQLVKEYEALFQTMNFQHEQARLEAYLQTKKSAGNNSLSQSKIKFKKHTLQVQHFIFRNQTKLVAAAFIGVFSSIAFYLLQLFFTHSNELIELKRTVANSIYKLEKKIDTKDKQHNVQVDNVGTGFLIDNDGYLVTNSHILKDAKNISVENSKGESFMTEVLHMNADIDLAILKIIDSNFTMKEQIPYMLANKQADLGESIFTLGYPKEDIVYGEGYLSSLTGYHSDSTALQMNIALNPGNSGGPIFDNYGNVIGIVRNKQKEVEGVSFALKSALIIKTIKQLKADDSLKQIKTLQLNTYAPYSTSNKLSRIKKYRPYIYLVKCYS